MSSSILPMVGSLAMASEGSARPKKEAASAEPMEDVIGEVRIEAGPAFSPRSRLAVRGLNVRAEREKEKVSLTLDQGLVRELRSRDASLSSTVNDLLHRAIAHQRLEALVGEMEAEAGPAAPDALQRVLEQWLVDDGG